MPERAVLAILAAIIAASPCSAAIKGREPMANAVKSAEGYIEDSLIDPTSAIYRHVTVVQTSPRKLNVCGYVYARNGGGLYSGRSQFVVELEDGIPTGMVSDLNSSDPSSQEELAAIASYGEAICSVPLREIEGRIGDMILREISADADARAASAKCAASARTADPMDTVACLEQSAKTHRDAYSRIFGRDYTGGLGLHSQ